MVTEMSKLAKHEDGCVWAHFDGGIEWIHIVWERFVRSHGGFFCFFFARGCILNNVDCCKSRLCSRIYAIVSNSTLKSKK